MQPSRRRPGLPSSETVPDRYPLSVAQQRDPAGTASELGSHCIETHIDQARPTSVRPPAADEACLPLRSSRESYSLSRRATCRYILRFGADRLEAPIDRTSFLLPRRPGMPASKTGPKRAPSLSPSDDAGTASKLWSASSEELIDRARPSSERPSSRRQLGLPNSYAGPGRAPLPLAL